jgi:hypothetical protein
MERELIVRGFQNDDFAVTIALEYENGYSTGASHCVLNSP